MAKGAVDIASNEFQKSLVRYGKKLKLLAAGRTCGDCRFYIRGLCCEQDIDVNNNDAVACRRHEKKAT